MGLRGGVALLLPGVIAACGGPNSELEARAANIETALRDRQAQLDALDRKVAAARHELDIEQCRAAAAQLDAEVSLDRAECLRLRAEFGQCVADNEARRAKGTSWGCILGLGAAVMTGGAAAPMVATGCGAGYVVGRGRAGRCPANPECSIDPVAIKPRVLSRHQLSTWPTCAP